MELAPAHELSNREEGLLGDFVTGFLLKGEHLSGNSVACLCSLHRAELRVHLYK